MQRTIGEDWEHWWERDCRGGNGRAEEKGLRKGDWSH